ncbi:sigma-54 interaction domain-containing protein [Anoxynatronum buryatiense]|uniref:HTH-type transcriptional regulatory protein TyrR n=1 Tax=Anoxynatronum buryatiense TaxID=489973 RepID=A0AA46AKM8_9CLOT|nr:sigma 54-interacting transcriptional regulator [Anoxynatronum buryatiense]SMP71354.1 regulatory protein, Fis family [Anoxynatronum buryatiense]
MKFDVVYDQDDCAIIPQDFAAFKIGSIITSNPAMIDLINVCLRIARSDAPILITGESGVGKELLAELIHSNSNRHKEPFLKINCAAIPDSLKESELFGYEPGAFTGALKHGKKGLIEASQNSTLLMDEIGEMPMNMQSTLLRVLQDGRFVRVGGSKEVKSDVRLICATNKNLKDLVDEGLFRNDLYFRLNVIPIILPPLSERPEDISLLALYYTDHFNRQYNSHKRLHRSVLEAFTMRRWTGNVRELRNTMERLVLIAVNEMISVEDLDCIDAITHKEAPDCMTDQAKDVSVPDKPLKAMVEAYEIDLIKKAIERHGSLRKAAKALDVTPSTISRKLTRDK